MNAINQTILGAVTNPFYLFCLSGIALGYYKHTAIQALYYDNFKRFDEQRNAILTHAYDQSKKS